MHTGIPAQVEAQGKKADELIQALQPENAAVVDPAVNPENPGVAQPAAAVAPAVAETVDSLKQKLAESEHKFSVLKGKYDSEIAPLKNDVNILNSLKGQIRKLTGDNSTLNASVQDLQGKLTEANGQIAQLQQQIAQPAASPEVKPVFSEEDMGQLREEGFDEKTIAILEKVLKRDTPAAAAPAQPAQAQPAAAAPAKSQAELAQEREREKSVKTFWQEFEKGVPDWETINGNTEYGIPMMPEFDSWLDGQMPNSVQTRRQALVAAQGILDHLKVVQIFNEFKSEHNLTVQQQQQPEHKINPEQQIEPASSVVHSDPGQQPQGKIYTRQEINDFYKDYAIKMASPVTPQSVKDQLRNTDADIVKANSEGRIQS
jgi:hypothetical protein